MSRPAFRLRSVPLAATLAAVAACGGTDPFAPVASFSTQDVRFVVYPLSSSPEFLPTALSLYSQISVRPVIRVGTTGLALNFDLAVDLDAQDQVRLLPPRLLIAPQAGGGMVTGFQVITGTPYDSLLRAPNTGYRYDSVTVVRPGQVVAVQTQGAGSTGVVCAASAPIYARLVVDSIRPSADVAGARAIYIRARVDPNCGFRSLDAGVPKD